jgi:hypothetical protein
LEKRGTTEIEYNEWEDTYSLYIVGLENLDQAPAVILGEYVHNLRSSLDNLITHLVETNRKRPGRHNAFPIYTTKKNWLKDVDKRSRGKACLVGVSIADWATIRSLQPYQGRNETEAKRTDLAVINRISNADKHRALHATHAMIPEFGERTYSPTPPGTRIEETWHAPPGTPFDNRAEVVRVRVFPPEGYDGDVHVNPSFPIGVAFRDEDGNAVGMPQVRSLWQSVIDVIARWDETVREIVEPQLRLQVPGGGPPLMSKW